RETCPLLYWLCVRKNVEHHAGFTHYLRQGLPESRARSIPMGTRGLVTGMLLRLTLQEHMAADLVVSIDAVHPAHCPQVSKDGQ
ncbi:MAG: hypothetical protein LGR52_01230, partial [Candidatus Thiosymbion ectosymbiont of Robbea hypermnestra]|nr:hypothetical protein [Candidatus Thiosymbion ectosymbiont of Robbea hypermnestra]